MTLARNEGVPGSKAPQFLTEVIFFAINSLSKFRGRGLIVPKK